jgi:hypothetical protein
VRKGIARSLLTARLSEATDRVALLVSADNAPERRLYGIFRLPTLDAWRCVVF